MSAEKEDAKNKDIEVDLGVERYLQMNEREKDLETQKALFRLQKRISEILYFAGIEKTTKVTKPEKD